MQLAAAARAQMLAAAARALPHEACGLLFGAAGHIRTATIARNIAAEPWHRFEIDPAHLFAAQRRARTGPERLLGCWHSHPGGRPCPSVLDRAGVQDLAWLWLIVAGGAVRAFRPLPHGPQSAGSESHGFAEVALVPAEG